MSQEVFDNTYRVYDADINKRANPFPSVTMQRTRRYDWHIQEEIRLMVESGLPEKLQMGIDDLFALPVNVYNLVKEIAITEIRSESKKLAEVQAGIQQQIDALTKNNTDPKKKK